MSKVKRNIIALEDLHTMLTFIHLPEDTDNNVAVQIQEVSNGTLRQLHLVYTGEQTKRLVSALQQGLAWLEEQG